MTNLDMYNQSAVIPYRRQNGKLEILLITNRKRKRWVVPKGIIEPHLTPAESAVQEAWEEAGIKGQVQPQPIGHYHYDKWGGTCRVELFLFRVETVHAQWLEDFRQRQWFSVPEAAHHVREKRLQELILQLPQFVETMNSDEVKSN